MCVEVEKDIRISVMNSVWQVIHRQQPGNIGRLNCLANRWMAATEEGNDILKCARRPSYIELASCALTSGGCVWSVMHSTRLRAATALSVHSISVKYNGS